ncbi:MAG: YceI family protein [Segetibacter sp.]|nr:YceI family protein [Segetibacter sp.]
MMLIAAFINAPLLGIAQEKYSLQTLDVSIKGTSSLHDWEMKSDKGTCEATVVVNKQNVSFSKLIFSLPANSLKSGHGMMDKNTYKALDVKKNPIISFVLSSAKVTPIDATTYQFKGIGNLTIAGATKETDLNAVCKYNAADESFSCTGTKSFKMTEYSVKPPTVMLGTIKTGDAITITYKLKIKN